MSEKSRFEKGRFVRESRKALNTEKAENETLEKRIFQELKDFQDLDYYDQDYWVMGDNIASDIRALAHSALKEGNFTEVVDIGRRLLVAYNVQEAGNISSSTPTSALAIAEACNLAAKAFNPSVFYAIKPAIIVAAWKLGAEFGKGDDYAYYLGDPVVGTASFHDPDDEVEHIVEEVLHEKVPMWEHPWSGVVRQDEAFEILDSLSNGGRLAGEFAESTLPSDMKQQRERWMKKEPTEEERVKLGEILSRAQSEKKPG